MLCPSYTNIRKMFCYLRFSYNQGLRNHAGEKYPFCGIKNACLSHKKSTFIFQKKAFFSCFHNKMTILFGKKKAFLSRKRAFGSGTFSFKKGICLLFLKQKATFSAIKAFSSRKWAFESVKKGTFWSKQAFFSFVSPLFLLCSCLLDNDAAYIIVNLRDEKVVLIHNGFSIPLYLSLSHFLPLSLF